MAQFTLFCRLPPEIRDETQQLCLPRRILELDNPVLHNDNTCWTGYATWHNCRPPALTRSCREARRVAQVHGKFNRLSLHSMPFMSIANRFWHQLCLDSVHLKFLSDDEEPPYQGKTPLSEALVTNSGLFGQLGDEIVKLIDIDPFDVIERYRRLFCASKRQSEYVQSLFNALAPSSASREPLPTWPQTVQTLLLAAACKARDAADPDPDLDTFWMQVDRETLPGGFLEAQSFVDLELHTDFFAGRLVPNYDNALVQRLVAGFPTSRPSVMFPACTYDRCEEMVAKIGIGTTFPMTTEIRTINTCQG
ncbi:hypothetical protein G3M48_007493 [Beauveria asiatica]|uniref:2EXR domain-containing protein n=1 Tax=Beauveria asiatica TaxID=1069075 RepID=A0AAW0RN48_9HYPO